MTQKTTTAQPSSSEELWAAYERQKVNEEDSWSKYQRCLRRTQEALAYERTAYEQYRHACHLRDELFDSAYQATWGQTPDS